MSAHVYYDKNRKRYYIKNYVNKVNHTIIFDNNGNYFRTKRDCYVFINENLKALENQPKKPKKNETLNTCDEFKAIYALVVLAFILRNVDISIAIKSKGKDNR